MELRPSRAVDMPAGPVSIRGPALPPAYLYGKSPEPSFFQFVVQFQAQQPKSGPESLEIPEDWVTIYHFKTLPCEGHCKRFRDCWYYHGNYDYRRIPTFDIEAGWFNYFSKKCVVEDWHSECGYAHNTFEMSFHPLLYRTKLCKGKKLAGFCSIFGRFCGFAHTSQELRYPSIIYPLQAVEFDPPSPESSTSSPPGLLQPCTEEQSEAMITPEGLLCLARTKGALDAKLKQLMTLSTRRSAELRCANCQEDVRIFVLSECGHCLCYHCEQRCISQCPVCGKSGSTVVRLLVD